MTNRSSRRGLLVAAVALLSGVGAFGTSAVSAAPRQTADTWTAATNGRRFSRSSHPKLEPSLNPDVNFGPPRAASARPDASGRVRVDVDGPDTAALQLAITDVGGETFSAAPESIRADVPQAELGRLADDPRVEHVHAPRMPRPSLTSEGVAGTSASTWQAAGHTGAGVKVAVVDLGFTGLSDALTAGALPPSTTKSQCGNGSPSSLDGNTDHGVGVAEIVHQMAPDASLYLVCFDQAGDIRPIVMYLASQGVTIVNASWGSVYTRGDGSGGPFTAAGAIAAGRAAGQLWVVSSGNENGRHYNFQATDADGDRAVELRHPSVAVPGPDDSEMFGFTLAPGHQSDIVLKWDAWPLTTQEFELCVWFDRVEAGNEVACFPGGQSAHPDLPILEAEFTGLTGHSHYVLAILRVNATISPRMDLYFHGDENFFATTGGSITDPGSSPAALAVGAYNFSSLQIEPFSGDGPTIDGRTKPDISGPDGVSNDVFDPFFGTSAATPHVTGAAALVKQIDPSLSPSQIQEFLQRKAIDESPSGFDNESGWGRLDLGNSAMASGAGDPVGSLDPVISFQGGMAVSGIAFDPDTVVPSQISVVVDRGQTISGVAVIPRSDTALQFANVDGVFHGFAVSVALAPGVHQLCVSAVNAPSTVGVDTGLGCVSGMALAGGSSGRRDVDFNGDGRADLAVMRPGSPADQWFALGLAGSTLYGDSGRGDVAVPADYNGDGRAEPAVFRPTSPGQWWISGRASPVIFGQPGDIPVVGDYNGDGRADVAVYRPGNPGQFFVNGFPNQPLLFGQASLGDIPAPGNYNVAGRTDFAVFRPGSPGQWFVNGVPGSTAFGEAGDVPVPADYNGDGRADFGVVRLSGPAMQWFINGVGVLLFGDSRLGDIPMPADYNGDNRVDVAVVRPGTPSHWYLNGLGSTAFGQATDIPVSGS